MRRRWRAGLVLCLLVAGCQPYPFAFPGTAYRALELRTHRPPAPVHVIPARWSLSTQARDCTARATASDSDPGLHVRVAHRVHLLVTPGKTGKIPRHAILAFWGPGGAWTLHAIAAGEGATVTLPPGKPALSHLMALLDGGQLRVSGWPARPAILRLPDAGVSGRDWIGCAQQRLKAADETPSREAALRP